MSGYNRKNTKAGILHISNNKKNEKSGETNFLLCKIDEKGNEKLAILYNEKLKKLQRDVEFVQKWFSNKENGEKINKVHVPT